MLVKGHPKKSLFSPSPYLQLRENAGYSHTLASLNQGNPNPCGPYCQSNEKKCVFMIMCGFHFYSRRGLLPATEVQAVLRGFRGSFVFKLTIFNSSSITSIFFYLLSNKCQLNGRQRIIIMLREMSICVCV